jgi:hypothetical protein
MVCAQTLHKGKKRKGRMVMLHKEKRSRNQWTLPAFPSIVSRLSTGGDGV